MKRYLKWFALILPLLTTACHYQFTGPLIWAHEGRAAFHLWFILWAINVTFLAAVVIAIKGTK